MYLILVKIKSNICFRIYLDTYDYTSYNFCEMNLHIVSIRRLCKDRSLGSSARITPPKQTVQDWRVQHAWFGFPSYPYRCGSYRHGCVGCRLLPNYLANLSPTD